MDSYPQDFPYGILDVAELLHLQRRRPGPNSVYTDCPFCKDRRGKMNLNYVKNVWRCNYCGEQGGMLSLYARLNHITNSEANREIREALRIENTAYSSRPVIKVTEGSGDRAGIIGTCGCTGKWFGTQQRFFSRSTAISPRGYTGNTSDSFTAFWNADLEDAAQIAFAV